MVVSSQTTAVASSAGTEGIRPRSPRRSLAGGNPAFWYFVGPFLIGLLVFTYIPVIWSAYLSFFDARNTALSTFLTAQTVSLSQLFLAAAVAILPLIFVFLFLQRFLVQGVAQSGLKG